MLNATYHDLSTGSLIENWEDTSRLSVNDDWSAVASIEGYFIGTPNNTSLDVQTALTDVGRVLDVNANQISGTFNTGGVTELQLSTPIGLTGNGTVGMQGSGTADQEYLNLYINNSAQATPVRIRYDLIDVDSDGNTNVGARQQFALQYRLTNSGNYVNVPAAMWRRASPGSPRRLVPLVCT